MASIVSSLTFMAYPLKNQRNPVSRCQECHRFESAAKGPPTLLTCWGGRRDVELGSTGIAAPIKWSAWLGTSYVHHGQRRPFRPRQAFNAAARSNAVE